MKIGSAIAFPFRGPNAWVNIGCLLLCMLIPIVGPMVATGFLVRVEKLLIENIQSDVPRFNFNRFSDYLQKGLWPFLASLVMSLILMPVFALLGVGVVLAVIALQKQTALMAIVIAILALIYIISILLFGVVGAPMMFKAGMEESFAAAFDRPFVFDYLKRVGLLTLGTQFLMMLIFLPLSLVGICIPIVGPYALISVILQIQAHIMTQLYLAYLDRGGIPLAIKPELPEFAAFPVQPAGPRLPSQSPA